MGIIQKLFEKSNNDITVMASLFQLVLDLAPILPAYFLAHALVGPMHAPLISGGDIILLLLTAGISRRLSGLHALKLYGSNLFVLKHVISDYSRCV